MIWILSIGVLALVVQCVVLGGRVRKLHNDLEFWRDEAIRLNNEKPIRGKMADLPRRLNSESPSK